MMEEQNTPAGGDQDALFKKRRDQKNWIVILLVMTCVSLVWSVTMIKIQNGIDAAKTSSHKDTYKGLSDAE